MPSSLSVYIAVRNPPASPSSSKHRLWTPAATQLQIGPEMELSQKLRSPYCSRSPAQHRNILMGYSGTSSHTVHHQWPSAGVRAEAPLKCVARLQLFVALGAGEAEVVSLCTDPRNLHSYVVIWSPSYSHRCSCTSLKKLLGTPSIFLTSLTPTDCTTQILLDKAELSLCVSLGFGPRGTSFLFGNSQIFYQKQ